MVSESKTKSCCSPSRPGQGVASKVAQVSPEAPFYPLPTVDIPAGKALIGTRQAMIPDDGEAPLRRKSVSAFRMSSTTVTNAAFADFIADTGYVTEAEEFGWSFVFYSDLPQAIRETQGVVGTEWWRRVDGVDWRAINGPGSEDAWKPDHPCVQVSWRDATAFANWCGGRLPTEAEWEHAARGGLGDVRYPWGDAEPNDTDHHPCNIWQGQFPEHNTASDGWAATAPAKSFAPNGYGLYNMVGNVWEWTSEPYRVKSLKKRVKERLSTMAGYKTLKGGSFLCHQSYCFRYRIAARIGNSPDSATSHTGFRIVWDAA